MRTLHDSARTLASALFLALIVIGISGLSWDLFKDDGWIERRIGALWGEGFRHPMILAPIIVGTVLAANAFLHGGLVPGKGRRTAQAMIYLFISAGLYYTYRWLRG